MYLYVSIFKTIYYVNSCWVTGSAYKFGIVQEIIAQMQVK